MPADLVARVDAALASRGILPAGRVAVAVSGGVDSTVLLHVLARLAPARGWTLEVVTFDHGLRPESAGEAEGVAAMAQALGVPARVVALGLAPGPELQARARSARYAVLDGLDAASVALGHHRDDQAETVLDRLTRGAGAGGLGGMAWRRGRYVRPLLEEPREALVAWARANGLRWIEDPSNARGTRGALRHHVIPALEAIRPGAAAAVARSAAWLADDEDLLAGLAGALLTPEGIPREALASAHPALARRAVLRLIRATWGPAVPVDAAQVGRVLALSRAGAWLPIGLCGRIVLDTLSIRALPPPPPPARFVSGAWGPWRIEAQSEVTVCAAAHHPPLGGRRVGELLRRAGVSAPLRPWHPVCSAEGGAWIPGVPLGKAALRVGVRAWRAPLPSLPEAGPFVHEL